ncbi:class B sortase [Paenibacillus sp. GYB003]|uniref:class B sortase n=1 Tax=Paenibacillus sp. GYB003 TaxID=2994392 RepID=UPI002F961AA9
MVKPTIRKFIFYGMLSSSLVLLCYFSYALASWHLDAKETNQILEEVQQNTVSPMPVSAQSANIVPVEGSNAQPFLPVNFGKLLKQNEETVGWLRIGSVGIDMPIVQTTDNEFYLNHDFDKRPSSLGWVFASASSNMKNLGTNTVLYGHNLSNKRMFGSLKGLLTILKEQPDSGIIQLTTPSQQMVFKIVSIYVTDEDDMLYVGNGTQLPWRESFVEYIREKNQIKSIDNHLITPLDQYLTLSTCYGPAGTTKRLAVHAQLVAVKDNSAAAV